MSRDELQPLVVVTRSVPGKVEVPGARVQIGGHEKLSRAALLDSVRGATVVVSMYFDRVDDEFLDAAGPQLKGVCNYAVGYNNIDIGACQKRGVVVTNTPDA